MNDGMIFVPLFSLYGYFNSCKTHFGFLSGMLSDVLDGGKCMDKGKIVAL